VLRARLPAWRLLPPLLLLLDGTNELLQLLLQCSYLLSQRFRVCHSCFHPLLLLLLLKICYLAFQLLYPFAQQPNLSSSSNSGCGGGGDCSRRLSGCTTGGSPLLHLLLQLQHRLLQRLKPLKPLSQLLLLYGMRLKL
jgi:hypothetical protein